MSTTTAISVFELFMRLQSYEIRQMIVACPSHLLLADVELGIAVRPTRWSTESRVVFKIGCRSSGTCIEEPAAVSKAQGVTGAHGAVWGREVGSWVYLRLLMPRRGVRAMNFSVHEGDRGHRDSEITKKSHHDGFELARISAGTCALLCSV